MGSGELELVKLIDYVLALDYLEPALRRKVHRLRGRVMRALLLMDAAPHTTAHRYVVECQRSFGSRRSNAGISRTTANHAVFLRACLANAMENANAASTPYSGIAQNPKRRASIPPRRTSGVSNHENTT